jgi:GR25 family glycosyltransferase involved in LPS biosynthesis
MDNQYHYETSQMFKVISLERTPQRFEQFLAWNFDQGFERFVAFDGSKLVVEDCIRQGLISASNRYVAGALGVALSHVTLWQNCVTENRPFHIAEDDIILRTDFRVASAKLLETVRAWDIVLWTHNFDWPVKVTPSPGAGPAVIKYDDPCKIIDPSAFRSATSPSVLLPLVSAASLACYSISPTGAKKMLSACLPIGDRMAEYAVRADTGWINTGLDVEMSRHYAKQNAFLAMPPLALAQNDHETSTIRGNLAL